MERIKRTIRAVLERINDSDLKTHFLYAIPFWVASLLTGIIAVCYTKLFSYSEDLLEAVLAINRGLIFIITPVGFLLAWYVVKFAPAAIGSGIPQVMAAIDMSDTKRGDKIDVLLNGRVILIKVLSSLFMVLGGGAIGREGPTIQIAGSVFRMVNKWIPQSWPKLHQKSFILTGAAAGLAAAFNTPLGGIVFAIEELAKIHISYFRSALFTAVIIAGLTAQGFLGPYLYLGYPDVRHLQVIAYAGVIVSAIVSGLLGALMSNGIIRIIQWKKSLSNLQSVCFILVTALSIASIAYFLNDHILGSGKVLMNQTLFTGAKSVTWDTVLVRLLGTMFSFNVGGAGGVFAPALAAGASVGGFLCHLFEVTGASANILILSGMVGFLTGVTRTPFTSAILVLEMTDRHSVIFHLMLAALVSNIAALIVGKRSLYEELKKNYIYDGASIDNKDNRRQ